MTPLNSISAEIIDAAIEVHRALGPGLLESAYSTCLAYELRERGFLVETQVALPVVYKGIRLDVGYRLDMVVDSSVIVETKAIAKLIPVHDAQLLTYLRLSNRRLGLILNFHESKLVDGLKRIVNGL
jgi:GxxExxY protein